MKYITINDAIRIANINEENLNMNNNLDFMKISDFSFQIGIWFLKFEYKNNRFVLLKKEIFDINQF